MSSHGGLFYALFLLVLSYLPMSGFTQRCDCPEYVQLKKDYDSSGGDSEPYTKKLMAASDDICQAKGYEWAGTVYASRKNFDTAELKYRWAESKFRESECNDSVLIFLYGSWAELHYHKGDFPKTQEYCLKLLKSSEAAGNYYRQAVANTMIAQVLNQTAQAHNGITYSRRAVALLKKIDDPAQRADLFFKLSKRYLWHYQDTKAISSLDSSEWFSNQQLQIARGLNNINSLAMAFGNLEGVAYERGDFITALRLLDSSFSYTDPGDFSSLGTNYYDKADLLIELKNYKEAGKMADSALYYRKLMGNTTYIAEVYGLMAGIYEKSRDYQKAYEFKELERAIIDSVRNVEKTRAVSELEKK
jgi:tetratricopeptide (TPR) repeat protein